MFVTYVLFVFTGEFLTGLFAKMVVSGVQRRSTGVDNVIHGYHARIVRLVKAKCDVTTEVFGGTGKRITGFALPVGAEGYAQRSCMGTDTGLAAVTTGATDAAAGTVAATTVVECRGCSIQTKSNGALAVQEVTMGIFDCHRLGGLV